MQPLIALIQSEPGMAQRLLAEHADDGTGRCRRCSTGAQTGHYRWPCLIYHSADQAHQHPDPDDHHYPMNHAPARGTTP